MNLTFLPTVGVQVEQWCRDALASSTVDFDAAINATVNVTVVDEPSAPGHNDYMATSNVNGVWRVEIRRGADDPASPWLAHIPGPIRLFLMECFVHELAHILMGLTVLDDAARTAITRLFARTSPTGRIGQAGTLVDWAAGAWEDRIEEAAAETLKDAALPELRVYDNRTYWAVSEADFPALMALMMPAGDGDTPDPPAAGFVERFTADPTGAWTDLLTLPSQDTVRPVPVIQNEAFYPGSTIITPPTELTPRMTCADSTASGATSTLLPLGAASFVAGGPHPVRLRVYGSASAATMDVYRRRASVDTLLASVGYSGGLVSVVTETFDVTAGDEIFFRVTSFAGPGHTTSVEFARTNVWAIAEYRIPNKNITPRGRYSVKGTYPVESAGGNGPDDMHGEEWAHLRLKSADATKYAILTAARDRLYLATHAGGPPDLYYSGFDIAAGGTYWFTLDIATRTQVRAGIWASQPPASGGTPLMEMVYNDADYSNTTLIPEFRFYGQRTYPDGRPVPGWHTHYDDLTLTPHVTPAVDAEHPEWPYLPPILFANPGAPAALRLP